MFRVIALGLILCVGSFGVLGPALSAVYSTAERAVICTVDGLVAIDRNGEAGASVEFDSCSLALAGKALVAPVCWVAPSLGLRPRIRLRLERSRAPTSVRVAFRRIRAPPQV